jgi:predicted acylesterase/phospholipase RssA
MPEYAEPVSQEGKALKQSGAIKDITIKQATRATSAAPSYFPPATMGKNPGEPQFWDGGLLNNNPIDQLWRARLDLVGSLDPPPKVACVLSLGTSWSDLPAPGFLDNWPRVKNSLDWIAGWAPSTISNLIEMISPVQEALPFLTNTEAKHLDFRRYINRMYYRVKESEGQTEYFRFNTPTKKVYIDMSDYKKMPDLTITTNEWLEKKTGWETDWVDKVAKILAKGPEPTAK